MSLFFEKIKEDFDLEHVPESEIDCRDIVSPSHTMAILILRIKK